MNIKRIVQFIYELGVLKEIRHEGWRVVGVKSPETVAAHALRATQIAFILAKLEKVSNPHRIVTMVAFHDIGECRIGDLHKIAARYVKADEERAVSDQTKVLEDLGEEIFDLWKELEHLSTKEGEIAKDADLIEQAFTAREYQELGHDTENWLDNINNALKSDAAKLMFKNLKKEKPYQWLQGLKKIGD